MLPELVSPVVEALVIVACVPKSVVTVPTVVEEVLNTDLLRTVRNDVEALPRVLCPVTLRVDERVSAVADAFPSTVCPETVNAVAEAVASVACPVAERVLV